MRTIHASRDVGECAGYVEISAKKPRKTVQGWVHDDGVPMTVEQFERMFGVAVDPGASARLTVSVTVEL